MTKNNDSRGRGLRIKRQRVHLWITRWPSGEWHFFGSTGSLNKAKRMRRLMADDYLRGPNPIVLRMSPIKSFKD